MTLAILVVTVLVSFLAFRLRRIAELFIFNPYIVKHNDEWYRFISSGFIHADWIHLLVNMFVFYTFGEVVEQYYDAYFGSLGKWLFLLMYIGAIVISIVPTFSKHSNNADYNALGASGGVSAVLFAYILFSPMTSLCLYGLLCLPGIVWGVVYLGYSYYMDKKSTDHINHDAHFWGAIFGLAFTLFLDFSLLESFSEQITTFSFFNR